MVCCGHHVPRIGRFGVFLGSVSPQRTQLFPIRTQMRKNPASSGCDFFLNPFRMTTQTGDLPELRTPTLNRSVLSSISTVGGFFWLERWRRMLSLQPYASRPLKVKEKKFLALTALGVSGGAHQSRRGGVGGRVGDTNTGS